MNDEAEELTTIDCKGALGGVETHAELPKRLERLIQICQIGVGELAFHDHVVDVYLNVLPDLVLEHLVKCSLVC